MKRFIKNLLLFLVVQLLVWGAIVVVYIRCRPIGQHYIAASIDKQRLLAQQESPRIVFVGGSNLAFGLDSVAVANETSFKPVNMGLHVELGLDFILHEAKSGLRNGDVVVLSPEYELFGVDYSGGGEILYTAVEQHMANLQHFSSPSVLRITDNGFLLLSQILDYDYRCLTKGKLGYDPTDPKNVYRRSAFNAYGDVIAHYGMPRKEFPFPKLDSKVNSRTIKRTISRLLDFQQWCQQNGIRVVFTFPTVPEQYMQQNRSSVMAIKDAVQSLAIPVLSTPEEMTFPLDDFFDTPYHLTETGIGKRTTILISRLKEKGIAK
jgi:hypothetical protein